LRHRAYILSNLFALPDKSPGVSPNTIPGLHIPYAPSDQVVQKHFLGEVAK